MQMQIHNKETGENPHAHLMDGYPVILDSSKLKVLDEPDLSLLADAVPATQRTKNSSPRKPKIISTPSGLSNRLFVGATNIANVTPVFSNSDELTETTGILDRDSSPDVEYKVLNADEVSRIESLIASDSDSDTSSDSLDYRTSTVSNNYDSINLHDSVGAIGNKPDLAFSEDDGDVSIHLLSQNTNYRIENEIKLAAGRKVNAQVGLSANLNSLKDDDPFASKIAASQDIKKRVSKADANVLLDNDVEPFNADADNSIFDREELNKHFLHEVREVKARATDDNITKMFAGEKLKLNKRTNQKRKHPNDEDSISAKSGKDDGSDSKSENSGDIQAKNLRKFRDNLSISEKELHIKDGASKRIPFKLRKIDADSSANDSGSENEADRANIKSVTNTFKLNLSSSKRHITDPSRISELLKPAPAFRQESFEVPSAHFKAVFLNTSTEVTPVTLKSCLKQTASPSSPKQQQRVTISDKVEEFTGRGLFDEDKAPHKAPNNTEKLLPAIETTSGKPLASQELKEPGTIKTRTTAPESGSSAPPADHPKRARSSREKAKASESASVTPRSKKAKTNTETHYSPSYLAGYPLPRITRSYFGTPTDPISLDSDEEFFEDSLPTTPPPPQQKKTRIAKNNGNKTNKKLPPLPPPPPPPAPAVNPIPTNDTNSKDDVDASTKADDPENTLTKTISKLPSLSGLTPVGGQSSKFATSATNSKASKAKENVAPAIKPTYPRTISEIMKNNKAAKEKILSQSKVASLDAASKPLADAKSSTVARHISPNKKSQFEKPKGHPQLSDNNATNKDTGSNPLQNLEHANQDLTDYDIGRLTGRRQRRAATPSAGGSSSFSSMESNDAVSNTKPRKALRDSKVVKRRTSLPSVPLPPPPPPPPPPRTSLVSTRRSTSSPTKAKVPDVLMASGKKVVPNTKPAPIYSSACIKCTKMRREKYCNNMKPCMVCTGRKLKNCSYPLSAYIVNAKEIAEYEDAMRERHRLQKQAARAVNQHADSNRVEIGKSAKPTQVTVIAKSTKKLLPASTPTPTPTPTVVTTPITRAKINNNLVSPPKTDNTTTTKKTKDKRKQKRAAHSKTLAFEDYNDDGDDEDEEAADESTADVASRPDDFNPNDRVDTRSTLSLSGDSFSLRSCGYCRTVHHGCSKRLPKCERCLKDGKECVYPPPNEKAPKEKSPKYAKADDLSFLNGELLKDAARLRKAQKAIEELNFENRGDVWGGRERLSRRATSRVNYVLDDEAPDDVEEEELVYGAPDGEEGMLILSDDEVERRKLRGILPADFEQSTVFN